MLVEHWFLVQAENFKKACSRIRGFLEKYQLIAYERIFFEKGLRPEDPLFWQKLEETIAQNRHFVEENLELLYREGYQEIPDLKNLPQGYLSKQLHIIVHFLDGFFGVDSFFYNLEEDSHWISPELYRQLKEKNAEFWLVKTRASSLTEGPLFEKFKRLL